MLTDEQIKEIEDALPKANERETVYVSVQGSTLRALYAAAQPAPDVVEALRWMLREAEHAKKLALRYIGVGIIDLRAIEAARSATK